LSFDREVVPFAVVAGVATGIVWAMWPWLAVVPAIALLFVLNFFRDPERRAPGSPGTLLAPADGKVLVAREGKISIFMNVFDVHVCRCPVAGRIESVEHVAGDFAAAFRDAASDHNERVVIDVRGDDSLVRFVLVAGLVARRIVCRVREGDRVRAGDRVGIIRFGSRVDVLLPEGYEPDVSVGRRVRAGESILARRRGAPA